MTQEERFGLHLNQFSSPVVYKFIKSEKKQTLGDIVVSADHTNNHDNCTVAIKACKTFSTPTEDQSDFILCDPAMEAGVPYSLGTRYLYADITSRSTSACPTNGKEEPIPSIFDVLMKAGRRYEHLPPCRYT